MLSPVSQLLVRNRQRFTGRWLLVNPQDAQVFQELDGDICGFHQYFDIYTQACEQGQADKHHFGVSYPLKQAFDGIVIMMPKAKEQAQMLIANLVHCLVPDGQMLLAGDNKGGVKSAPKLFAPYSEHCVKLDSARHCALYGMQPDKPLPEFAVDNWLKEVTLNVGKHQYPIAFLPGVFSSGSLDPATRMLLENLHPVPKGRVLDFGCGAGVIGCYLGLENPQAEVVMADVSALALYCAEKSATNNGIKATVIPSHGLNAIDGSFAAAYTNPPFHTGLNTDYDVTLGFIRQLSKFLQPGAVLQLVANGFIPYLPILQENFKAVKVAAESSKFRLYLAK
ncbi:class I SAM-dependent methyltransferase [Lacimicrobium alkaliphilum]|uniref:Ribosomal RNA small subunit methyltransferase C n=1 Tax=Lacimicrobium alkaliphilum TaxID=1526571 RepID=A0ABQ1R9B1_9ALTE|nr:class I SAM-dependent methyltransferase [Lacimicrobium alkaliphilum]GGD62071.1 ribosomal RNA small subunit methyltransferase C [Lacimicrobium alkaliphilum]